MIRPRRPSALASARGTRPRERAFVAWFGVRGIGSLYYAAVAVGRGRAERGAETDVIVWTAIACVVVSIAVHGTTATPLSRRLLSPEAAEWTVGRGPD